MKNNLMTEREQNAHAKYRKSVQKKEVETYNAFFKQDSTEWNNYLIAVCIEKEISSFGNFKELGNICAEKTAYEKLLRTNEYYALQEKELLKHANAYVVADADKYMLLCKNAMLDWKNYFIAAYAKRNIPVPNGFAELVIICAEKTATEQMEQLNRMNEKASQK